MAEDVKSPSSSHIVSPTGLATATEDGIGDLRTLRNRLPRRSATFGEGLSSSYNGPRRRSSTLSSYSVDGRPSFNSSKESLLLPKRPGSPRGPDEGTSHWDRVPLLFALLPAAAGMVITNGSAFVTDVLLLGIAGLVLHWSVTWPWDWYHAARTIVASSDAETHEHPLDEDSEAEVDMETESAADGGTGAATAKSPFVGRTQSQTREGKGAAESELRQHEVFALFACFIAPLLATYSLHAIRDRLSRPDGGLVSNYNLTIFLLLAEVKPFSHVTKMIQSRTLHLQRVVERDSQTSRTVDDSILLELTKRLDDVEANVAGGNGKSPVRDIDKRAETAEIMSSVKQTLQPQLDALNRAMRKYEKRSIATTIQTEARFEDLEARMRDALSLAAAAAQNGQRPGAAMRLLEWLSAAFMLPLKLAWGFFLYPPQLMASVYLRLKVFLFGGPRYPGKGKEVRLSGYGKLPGNRNSSRLGRR